MAAFWPHMNRHEVEGEGRCPAERPRYYAVTTRFRSRYDGVLILPLGSAWIFYAKEFIEIIRITPSAQLCGFGGRICMKLSISVDNLIYAYRHAL